jgi:hypothetical protein
MLPVISNELSKTQLRIMAQDFVANLENDGNPIKTMDTISKLELFIKEVKSNRNFIELVIDDVTKFGKFVTTDSGTKIELAEVGTKYDYTHTNDVILANLYKDEESINEKIKERESFLKSLPLKGVEIVDENGEVHHLFPPSKTSTSSVKTTITR